MNDLTLRPSEIAPRPGQIAESDVQRDLIILDGSGSMQHLWFDMLHAIDTYVDGLKRAQTQSHITLSIFTSPLEHIDMVARDSQVSDWKSLLQDPPGSYWGGTPLYDAIEVGLLKLRNELPKRAAITICTDGGENGSQSCDQTRARSILDWARARGWQVTFIGCDFNNDRVAAGLGATESATIGVQRKLLSEATKELALKRARYALSGAPMHWSESERSQFGGYLTSQGA
jgi:hypothetical protein